MKIMVPALVLALLAGAPALGQQLPTPHYHLYGTTGPGMSTAWFAVLKVQATTVDGKKAEATPLPASR
jgi:hypothetical protein